MGEGEVGSEEVSPAPRCNHPALPFRARSRRSVEFAAQNRSARVEGLQHLVPRQPLRPGAERFAEVYVGRERTIKQRRFGPIK
jgi:hypothetical protein